MNDVIIPGMQTRPGMVKEVRLDAAGRPAAWIECQLQSVPEPGQYLMGWGANDLDAALAAPLFASELAPGGFLAAAPLPSNWEPGTRLELRGPLGNGFRLPAVARRLALGAVGDSLDRLLPLVQQGLRREMAVTLYTDHRPASLSSAVEIYPLSSLPEALGWADLLALGLERQDLSNLRTLLGVNPERGLPCPVQALVHTPLPCAGVAECGVCAVTGRRHWKLACKDGPVFELRELDW
jgi:Iron-sulfur cluster binding domain of dihydroorotate dehydrogenase B